MADDARQIATRIPDEDETVPSRRCHGHRHTATRHVERDIPQQVTVARVHGDDVRVRRPTKDSPVHVCRAAIDGQPIRRRGMPHDLPPLDARARVDGVGDRVGREVHRSVHDDRSGLERGDLGQRVPTDDAEAAHVRPIDLGEG